jgi:hypothetical protein
VPSRARAASVMGAVALTVVLLSAAPAPAQPAEPTPAEIADALKAVKADPNLATERRIKSPRWRTDDTQTPGRRPGWLRWLANLFRWLDESARVLMWIAIIGGLAGATAYFLRLMRDAEEEREHDAFVAPTHVHELDIRPESLPDDIGAAARALWDRGQHRASLALLYRGLLSRLAHVHRAPIRDSTTEGDCIELAARHLAPASLGYVTRLVGTWQVTVYARRPVVDETVHALCDDFSSALALRSQVTAGESLT